MRIVKLWDEACAWCMMIAEENRWSIDCKFYNVKHEFIWNDFDSMLHYILVSCVQCTVYIKYAYRFDIIGWGFTVYCANGWLNVIELRCTLHYDISDQPRHWVNSRFFFPPFFPFFQILPFTKIWHCNIRTNYESQPKIPISIWWYCESCMRT